MNALRRLSLRVLLLQLCGNLVLILLAIVWLQIPDSHAWEFVLSMILAAIIVCAFLWLHASTIRTLRAPMHGIFSWLGALLLGVWLFVFHVSVHFLSKMDDNTQQRAGYWNSQLSAHMRATFTYDRLIAIQHDFVILVVWFLLPALLLPLAVETVARGVGGLRNGLRCLRRVTYWLTVFIGLAVIRFVSGWIVNWHPSYSVRGELFSVFARLSLVYGLCIAVLLVTMAVVTELLSRSDVGRKTAP